mgnify:CR=1 FL=1
MQQVRAALSGLSPNDTIVAIGATSDGIGAACVLDAAENGAKVSFCDINVEKGKAYEAELIAKGFAAFFVKADVSSMEDFERGHSEVVKKFGDVNGLISNAGKNAYFDPVEMTEAQWNEFMNLDLKSVWVGAKLVLPAMRKAKKGAIVNISSIHARMSYMNYFPYAAAKSGIIGLTRNLSLDEGKHNIRVNAVAPGFVETDMTAVMKPEQIEAAAKMVPLGRLGKVEDISKVVVFLCSSDAAYIQGEVISIDGGLFM